jgi:outer membrane receptor protein involved in Fe transport
MLYTTLSRSYKSGGFNATSRGAAFLDPEIGGDPGNAYYDPEFINSIEAGVKSRLFNNSVQANVTAFYYDQEDLQLNDFLAGSSYITNTDATIFGVEAELQWVPNAHWNFAADIAWIDTELDDFQAIDPSNPNQMNTAEGMIFIPPVSKIYAPCGCAGISTDLSGNELGTHRQLPVSAGQRYGAGNCRQLLLARRVLRRSL